MSEGKLSGSGVLKRKEVRRPSRSQAFGNKLSLQEEAEVLGGSQVFERKLCH